jgi:hypothetical protein
MMRREEHTEDNVRARGEGGKNFVMDIMMQS